MLATLEDARGVARHVVEQIHPLSVFVFGSVAREGSGNDLDIFIVVRDDEPRSPLELLSRLRPALKSYSRRISIDPFVVPAHKVRRHLDDGSPFLRMILREGRPLYMTQFMEQWQQQSNEDLRAAETLLKAGLYRACLYHCQQAVEKNLKVRLLETGWELERTHNIDRLATLAAERNLKVDLADDDVVLLDAIYRGRYPAERGLLPLGEPAEDDAARAVSIARRVLNVQPDGGEANG